MSITVYGYSDDLIEIEGDVTEEILAYDGDTIAFSNGVVLRCEYTRDGLWKIEPIVGADRVTIVQASDPEDDYSDRATFDGPVEWVDRDGGYGERTYLA